MEEIEELSPKLVLEDEDSEEVDSLDQILHEQKMEKIYKGILVVKSTEEIFINEENDDKL